MSQTVMLNVKMSCQGCAGAVQRVLGKMEGVESFDIDLKEQKVTVNGNVQPEAVFEAVSKTGKKTAFWEAEAPPPAEPQVKPAEEAPSQPEGKPAEAALAGSKDKPAEAAPADSKDKIAEAAPAASKDKPAEAVVAA